MIELWTFVAVGCGGAIGAFCRAFCTTVIEKRLKHWLFKGAFFINFVACFLAGFLMCMVMGDVVKLAVMVGFLGGFSTLSSVNLDAAGYFLRKQYGRCFGFLTVYYITAIFASVLGFVLASNIL